MAASAATSRAHDSRGVVASTRRASDSARTGFPRTSSRRASARTLEAGMARLFAYRAASASSKSSVPHVHAPIVHRLDLAILFIAAGGKLDHLTPARTGITLVRAQGSTYADLR